MIMVDKDLPCGHTARAPCAESRDTVRCLEPCERRYKITSQLLFFININYNMKKGYHAGIRARNHVERSALEHALSWLNVTSLVVTQFPFLVLMVSFPIYYLL